MKFPNKVSKGEPIKASLWNDLVDYLRSLTPRAGAGTRLDWGDSGFSYSTSRLAASGASSASRRPFELAFAGGDEEAKNIRVYYGTVNGTLPTGMSEGDATPYVFEGIEDETGVIWVGVTISVDLVAPTGRSLFTPEITACWLDYGASAPDDDFLEPTTSGTYTGDFHLVLGSFNGASVANSNAGGIVLSVDCQTDDNPSYITPVWGGI